MIGELATTADFFIEKDRKPAEPKRATKASEFLASRVQVYALEMEGAGTVLPSNRSRALRESAVRLWIRGASAPSPSAQTLPPALEIRGADLSIVSALNTSDIEHACA